MKKVLSILLISFSFAFTSFHAFTSIDTTEKNFAGELTSTIRLQTHSVGDLELVSGKETPPSFNSFQKTFFGTQNNFFNSSIGLFSLKTKAANAFLFLEKFLSHIYPFHGFW